MTHYNTVYTYDGNDLCHNIQIIRHVQVCKKLNVSSAKLFDMIAKGHFPKPFTIIPGGRAVGWLEQDVNEWIKMRSEQPKGAGV